MLDSITENAAVVAARRRLDDAIVEYGGDCAGGESCCAGAPGQEIDVLIDTTAREATAAMICYRQWWEYLAPRLACYELRETKVTEQGKASVRICPSCTARESRKDG